MRAYDLRGTCLQIFSFDMKTLNYIHMVVTQIFLITDLIHHFCTSYKNSLEYKDKDCDEKS